MDCRTVIKSLRMENFGCFEDKTILFQSGFNQLIGPNESGKSTVLKALFTVLFEDGSTSKRAVAAQGNWLTGKSFRLTLVFAVGDKEFTLVRDYGAGHDIMTDSDDITYEGVAIAEKLALYFGASDRRLFESVFCFSSDSPDAPETIKERLKSAIERPAFLGFDRGRADRYLDEEIKTLENPRAHGPRELDVITDQISTCLHDKTALETRLEGMSKDQSELDEVRHSLQEHDDRVSWLEREITGADAYCALDARMANIEERLQVHLTNYSRASQVAEELARIEEGMSGLYAPKSDELKIIVEERNNLTARVDETKKQMDERIALRAKTHRGFLVSSILVLMVCLFYIGRQIGYFSLDMVADLLPYGLAAAALFWVTRIVAYLGQVKGKKKATAVFRQEVVRLDAFYTDLNRIYRMKAADPVKSLEDSARWYDALQMSADNLRNTLDILSENRGLTYLTEIKKQIEREVADLNRELASLTGFASSSAKLPALKEELVVKRVRANALRERAALLTERCSKVDALTGELAQLNDQIEALKRKHKALTDHLEVLKVTRLALNRAADRLIDHTFTSYSADASAFLASLTGGRYNEVQFLKEPGRFEMKVSTTGRWMEITDAFSSSTRDAVYLALRLAAVRRLATEFAPPVIFDQAEVRMDEARRRWYYEVLSREASERQILYVGLQQVGGLSETQPIAFEEIKATPQPAIIE
jgi:DNA repair exonuclease SbcCD ATPase subunit